MVERSLGLNMRAPEERFSNEHRSADLSLSDGNMCATHDATRYVHFVLGTNCYGELDHALITLRIERAQASDIFYFGVIGDMPQNGHVYGDPTDYNVSDDYVTRAGTWVFWKDIKEGKAMPMRSFTYMI